MTTMTQRVRFGEFELDAKAGELWKGARRIRLQDKPLRLLVALIEQRGDIVTREELRERLWPGNVVVEFDNGLNNAVNKLRAALDDSAEDPRYIETVGRRGYRFVADLPAPGEQRAAPEPRTPEATEPATEEPLAPAPRLPASEAAPHGSRRPRALLVAATAVLLLVVATGWWLERRSPDVPEIHSLAVLPLENLSGDSEQEYFSDGMTDALIAQLAGVRSLRIISRQSVMRYKRSLEPMPSIGRELKVDAVIEGTVLRSADRVRVTVQLIHAASDRHLWSDQYERPLGDVLELQAEIARSVAREVQAVVTPQETARLAAAQPIDPEAYDLYLRGRYFWSLRTEDSLRRSLDYLRRALEIEPSFARAHAGLAEAYGPLGYNGWMSPLEATPQMKASALRALELDPDLVEGLTALGACAAFHEWNWAEGEKHFRRALEVSSNYSTAHGWYGQLLENLGRQQENLEARRRAFELDPLWIGTGIALGRALAMSGRPEEGIAQITRTLELDPNHAVGLSWLGTIYVTTGRYDEAIEAFRRGGDDGGLGHALAVAGRREEALEALARLEQRERERYVAPLGFALVHVGLGDHEAALAALERGYALRDPGMSGLAVDARFAPLESDARFRALLERMGVR
jgi:TolB-like protein/DNA-binding winged helix-turn-helix (wHTH) protein/Tfp pilus assembly protein PilF